MAKQKVIDLKSAYDKGLKEAERKTLKINHFTRRSPLKAEDYAKAYALFSVA
jgi:hypothetical protein